MRVGEPGEGLRLLAEAAARRLVSQQAGGQDLDRDVPIELLVAREVDLAHPALAELLDDAIRGERPADHRHLPRQADLEER